MADVNISKFRAQVVRDGSKPATPGFVVSEGQSPTDPAGSGQNHLPVTIAEAATGLAITESQILGGAGTVSQYIRGDGSLADFPSVTGGGASVNYYLNGSVSQGTIGGVAYKELNRTPIFGAGTDISINADGYIASFITDAGDPNKLLIPAGNWNFETYFSASSSGGSPSFYVELYKYDGTTFTLIASSSSSPELIAFGTSLNPYFSTLAVPQTTLALTDRLAVRFYVNHSGRTITLHTEDNHLCQVITTFTTGLTALNGLTTQVQNFATGTSGTDFNIASATATHTFNLPTASATNRGALSSADWTTFNNKENAITAGTTAQYFRGDKTFQTLNTSVVPEGTNLYYTEARVNANTNVAANTAARHNAVTLGTANGLSLSTQVLSLGLASAGVTGALSGTDWSTFNSKQNALTNPVTGTGTTNYLPKFTGASTIGNSNLTDGGVTILNENPTAGQFAWQFNGNTTTGQSFGASVVAGTNSSDISFRVLNAAANSTYFSIRGNGNTLIGTATDNGARLQVNGQAFFTHPDTPVRLNNSGGTFTQLDFLNNGTQKGAIWWNNSSNTLNLWTGVTTMTLTSGGNLLVGTTTDAGFKLDVNGTGRFTNNLTTNGIFIGRTSNGQAFGVGNGVDTDLGIFVQTNNILFANSGGSSGFSFAIGGSTRFSLASTGAATFSSTLDTLGRITITADAGNEQFTIRRASNTNAQLIAGVHSSGYAWMQSIEQNVAYRPLVLNRDGGNVLIGTTTDNGEKLQVNGEITAVTRIRINKSTQSNQIFGDGNAFNISGSNNLGIRNDSGSIVFASGGANVQMLLNTSGNVGIGTTSPGYRLVVNSATDGISAGISGNTYGIRFDNGGTFSSGMSTIHGVDNTLIGSYQPIMLNGLDVRFGTSATERMRITSSGNVGIGTASPATAGGGYTNLHINGNGSSLILSTNGSNLTYLYTLGTGGIDFAIENSGAQVFRPGGTERMRITSGGNVLIGTTTDNGAKLNVNGTIRTANPTGSTSDGWLLGRALVSGSSTPDRWIRVQIGNLYYDILSRYIGSV